MKKIMLLMLGMFILLSLSLVTAQLNTKTYDSNNKIISIKDDGNKPLADIQLIYNSYSCSDKCYSVFTMDIYKDSINPFSNLVFQDMVKGGNKNIQYSIKIRKENEGKYKIYNPLETLKGKYYIQISGSKDWNDKIDWQPTLFNLFIKEWEVWGNQYIYDDYVDNNINFSIWENFTYLGLTGNVILAETSYIRQTVNSPSGAGVWATSFLNTTAMPTYYGIANLSVRVNLAVPLGAGCHGGLDAFGIPIADVLTALDQTWLFVANTTTGFQFDVYASGIYNKTITPIENDISFFGYTTGVSGARTGLIDTYPIYYYYGEETININLNSPEDNENIYVYDLINFNVSYNTSINELKNISFYINDVLNESRTVTGISNNSFYNGTFSLGSYDWFVYICDSESNCRNSSIRSFTVRPFKENSQTFNATTHETLNEDFKMNLTYDSLNFGISAILVYNNTNYTGTKSGLGDTVLFSRTITIPQTTAQENKTFYWLIGLNNVTGTFYYNSTLNIQTIQDLSIDDCSINSNVILNISLLDEETRNYVDSAGANINIELNYGGINYYSNFTNKNNFSVCMNNLTYGNELDVTIEYTSTGRVIEYYYIDSHTLVSGDTPFLINLYNLNSSKSTSYLNTYKDCYYLYVDNAIIEVWRKYVSEGTFYLVEMSRTNEVGQTITHMVSEDVIYYYKVRKNGVLEYITDDFNALCIDTPCQININQKGEYCEEETFNPYQPDTSILYNFDFNKTSRILTFDFSTVDGSTATLNLTVRLFNQYLNSTTCSEQTTSAGGTLTCVLATTLLNSTYYAEVTKNNNYLDSKYLNLKVNPFDIFGIDGVLFTALLILTLCLMFIPTGWGVPVVAVLGFIIAGLLSLIAFNYTLILWLSLAALIIVLKIAKKRNSG